MPLMLCLLGGVSRQELESKMAGRRVEIVLLDELLDLIRAEEELL
jgi:hypothetical protein